MKIIIIIWNKNDLILLKFINVLVLKKNIVFVWIVE